MKLKYIIPFFIAALGMIVTSCSDDNDPTYLDGLRISQSYVAIPAEGGKTTITIDSKAEWQINEVPEWLTISPAKGEAGNQEVTFSAEAAEETREAALKLVSGSLEQNINVIQQTEAAEPVVLSITEALAMVKEGNVDKAVIIKGFVCKIDEISTSYGNATYYLSDDGTKTGSYATGDINWIEVYRGYWLDGEKFTDDKAFAIGDELTVSGTLVLYGGSTPEITTGSKVLALKKSLIGVDKVEMLGVEEGEGVTNFPLEGGQAKISLNVKGNDFHISIPAEAKSWLHIADFGADYVTLEADANAGGSRTVTVSFSTEADGVTYSCEQTLSQDGSIIKATVADFLAAEVGTTLYRMEGIITALYDSDKQGKSFYIRDFSGETLVYRADEFIESGAKVGDIVTVVGQRGEYKGTAQLVSGKLEEITHSVTAVTIEELLAKDDDPNTYYMVTGTVDEIANADYGNLYIKDGESRIYSYGCYPGWGATGDARKGLVAAKEIAVGDKITIIGPKSTFKDTPQISGGIYFSHESQVKAE